MVLRTCLLCKLTCRRFVQTKIKKLIEAFLVACVAASLSLTALMTVKNCSDVDKIEYAKEKQFAKVSDKITL